MTKNVTKEREEKCSKKGKRTTCSYEVLLLYNGVRKDPN